jgi:hypothetical protein
MTSRSWDRACLAVLREPLRLVASTTRAEREAADDPVADGEVLRERRRPQGKLRYHGPPRGDLAVESAILPRIRNIQTRTEHSHRPSFLESPPMGAGVDARGQAAGDDATAAGQVAGQLLGHGPPVRGGPPRADDGHRGISKSLRIALAIEDEGRIEDLSQVARISGVLKGQESIRLPPDFFQFPPGPVEGPAGDDVRGGGRR